MFSFFFRRNFWKKLFLGVKTIECGVWKAGMYFGNVSGLYLRWIGIEGLLAVFKENEWTCILSNEILLILKLFEVRIRILRFMIIHKVLILMTQISLKFSSLLWSWIIYYQFDNGLVKKGWNDFLRLIHKLNCQNYKISFIKTEMYRVNNLRSHMLKSKSQ